VRNFNALVDGVKLDDGGVVNEDEMRNNNDCMVFL